MRWITKVTCSVLLAGGIAASVSLQAQSRQDSSAPAAAMTEQQRAGQGLFLQNCSLCHLPTKKNPKSTKEEGTTIGPRLNGILNGPKPRPEAVVRTFIQKGVQGKMPGFQYALTTNEIDDILAYLKTL